MSGDTDKAKISDNQDEDKKSGTGDGQTTEDESSQDSKGESQATADPAPVQGNADVDQPDTKEEDKPPITQPTEGQVRAPAPQSGQCVHKSVFIYMATNLFGLISTSFAC